MSASSPAPLTERTPRPSRTRPNSSRTSPVRSSSVACTVATATPSARVELVGRRPPAGTAPPMTASWCSPAVDPQVGAGLVAAPRGQRAERPQSASRSFRLQPGRARSRRRSRAAGRAGSAASSPRRRAPAAPSSRRRPPRRGARRGSGARAASAGRSSRRRRCALIIATLMMSAALPCMTVFTARRSPSAARLVVGRAELRDRAPPAEQGRHVAELLRATRSSGR